MEVMQITPMENHLLLLICKGKKSHEIACIVHCTPKAALRRIENLLHKLGCSNRAEAVSFYYENIHPKQTQQ